MREKTRIYAKLNVYLTIPLVLKSYFPTKYYNPFAKGTLFIRILCNDKFKQEDMILAGMLTPKIGGVGVGVALHLHIYQNGKNYTFFTKTPTPNDTCIKSFLFLFLSKYSILV